jgi:hypothetical protein
MLKLVRHRAVTRALLVVATIGAVSTALVVQRALAAQPTPQADPVAHALGLDDAASVVKIKGARQHREATYRSAVSACMQAAGFIGVPASGPAAQAAASPKLSNDDAELVTGFGVTTAPADTSASPDPVLQYIAALSPADQERFVEAMSGSSGCDHSAAQHAMSRFLAAGDTYDKLETAMYNALAAKASVKAADAAWRQCMGQPTGFSNPSQISQYLFDKKEAIAADDAASLQALNQEELQLARADVSCRHKVVDPVFQPLLRKAKARLVAAHPAEIAALRRALRTG